MKVGARNHIKIKRLMRELGIPSYQAVGIVESLWLITAECADDGVIGRYSNADIALEIEWEGSPDTLIAALMKAGLLDEHPTHRFAIHDWLDHCPDFIKDRLRKREQRSCDDKRRDKDGTVRRKSTKAGDTNGTRPGESQLTNPIQSNPNQSPPPPPDRQEVEEAEIVSALRRAGVALAEDAVREARGRRVSLQEVAAIIEHFNSLQGAWDAGALYERVRRAFPGEDPTAASLWPEPSKEFTRRRSAELEAERQRQQQAEGREKKQADQEAERRHAELEREHGPTIDAMTDDEVCEVLEDHFYVSRFKRDREV